MAAPTGKKRDLARVQEFVGMLYELSGAESWAQFAQRAGLLPSTMSDYKRGKNAPNAVNLIKMIEAAGLLERDPIEGAVLSRVMTQLEREPQAGPEVPPYLRALSARVGELSFRLRQLAEQLDARSQTP